MPVLSLTLDNLVHQYPGVSLAMSPLRAIADFRLISEYDNLVSLGFAQTGSHNLGALDSGIPYQGVPVSPNKQHSIKFDSLTFRYT
jgi:hypothetical protein